MQEDVFKFDDFLKGNGESKPEPKRVFEDLEEEISNESPEVEKNEEKDDSQVDFEKNNPYAPSKEDMVELFASHEEDDFIKDEAPEVEEEIENEIEIKESTDNYYKLYSDKSEDFICDISIEGANPKETEARVVVESEDWTLMFSGEIKNGKCVVPIKKLNILKEGQVGNIRLEVIAEGNLFIPWEDKFKVKLSKKVTVKVNEQKEYSKKPAIKQSTVKVKVNK